MEDDAIDLEDLDLSLPDDRPRPWMPPPRYKRTPSTLVREARAAFDAGLFAVCLMVLVAIPDVCATLLNEGTMREGELGRAQRAWCGRYLHLPKGPAPEMICRDDTRTKEDLAKSLEALGGREFTVSDFSQLRNAVVHTESGVVTSKGEKHTPYRTIGVFITDYPCGLVTSYGSRSMSKGDVETDCRFDVTISLTTLLELMERGVGEFLSEHPKLDREVDASDLFNVGMVDMRDSARPR